MHICVIALTLFCIFAERFTQQSLIPFYVKYVIKYLESYAGIHSIYCEPVYHIFIRSREHQTGTYRCRDKVGGLVKFYILYELISRLHAFTEYIGGLPCYHPVCTCTGYDLMRGHNVVFHLRRIYGISYRLSRDCFGSRREQPVTCEYSHSFAVDLVVGRLAASQVVIVHCRQVVVDKRVCVYVLYRKCIRKCLFYISAGEITRGKQENWSEPLSAYFETVAHGLSQHR